MSDLVDDPVQRARRRHRLPEGSELLDRPLRVRLARARPRPAHAQRAPPEVPLSATTSTSSGRLPSSPSRTPAVKAVWLPPPWQAIATRLRLGCSSILRSVSASCSSSCSLASALAPAPSSEAREVPRLPSIPAGRVDRSASQRVASGQNALCALPPTTRPTWPASIAIDLTSCEPTCGRMPSVDAGATR